MAFRRRPRMPLPPMTYRTWVELYPEPTVQQLLTRWIAVYSVIMRYREAGYLPEASWLLETGLAWIEKRDK